MYRRRKVRRGWAARDVVLALTLVNYLTTTIGLPLPSSFARSGNDSGIAYPCQDHACGCASSEECWKGDCCCFTLEQKLTWAEAKGIEPPSHVRPLVEARKARIQPPFEKSCCSDSTIAGSHSKDSPCAHGTGLCELDPASDSACHHGEEASEDCLACVGKTEPVSVQIRWLGGIFTQKCRGTESANLLQLQVTGLPSSLGFQGYLQNPNCPIVPGDSEAFTLAYVPPYPPPRS